jgi:hypothetical protein
MASEAVSLIVTMNFALAAAVALMAVIAELDHGS